MKVYDGFHLVPERPPAVIAVGVFDGVHLGHQMIIRNAIDDAHRLGVSSAVVTFEPHPEEVFRPDPPPRLSGPDLKLELLGALSPDMVVRIPFDRDFASIPPDDFVQLLQRTFELRGVVVGANFHFGHGGRGTPEMLLEAGRNGEFEVDLVPLMQVDGETVSSTLIRTLIKKGDISGAKNRLGRLPVFTGSVVHGHHRGRDLGFRTANLQSPETGAVPGQGVYAGRAWYKGRPQDKWAAALSIGSQPTFNGKEIVTEVHLLDFEPGGGTESSAPESLYGSSLEVEVCCRIREQRRFDSAEELAAQISADIAEVRRSVVSCHD